MDYSSPVHNEELYYPVVRFICRHKNDNFALYEQALFDMKQIQLNRKDNVANDFTVTCTSGKQIDMHQIKKEYTLLLFYDPDCEKCDELITKMKLSPFWSNKATENHVAILAFYTGNDYTQWIKHQDKIPASWISGYDSHAKRLI